MVYRRLLATLRNSCAMCGLTTGKCLCHWCVLLLRRLQLVCFDTASTLAS